jgi:hypothetical protein
MRGILRIMPARHLLAVAASFAFLLACSREAKSADHPPARAKTVVLELFTSQGCSSCPPADALLSKLGRETFDGGRVIPLAYHVDYWNHLGWRDPFSSAEWSKRQNSYARVMKNSQVYTPQAVLNGRAQLVGSAERQVRAEIERQLDEGDRGSVVIDRATRVRDTLVVDVRAHLDKGASKNGAAVMVVLFENGITTKVASGENARRELSNDFIVRGQRQAMVVAPGAADAHATVTIPLKGDWKVANLGVVAFLENTLSMEIYASADRALDIQ